MKKVPLKLLALVSSAALAASPMIWDSGQFGKMLTSSGFKLSDQKQFRSLSVDPSALSGVTGAVGSLGLRNNSGTGELWLKTGSGDTAWSQVSSGGSFVVRTGDTMTGALGLNYSGADVSTALIIDSSRRIVSSAVTSTELGRLSGVASNVQTQLDAKVVRAGDTMTGALGLNYSGADVSTALILNSSRQIVSGGVSDVELGRLAGVTGNVQTQLNAKVAKAGDTMTGLLRVEGSFTGNTNGSFGASTASGTTLSLGTPSNAIDAGTAVNFQGSNSATNWKVGANVISGGGLDFIPSTAGGGTTFSVPAASLLASGATRVLQIGSPSLGSDSGSAIRLQNSNAVKNWQISANLIGGGALDFTQSTANGGTTYSTPVFSIASTGAATHNGQFNIRRDASTGDPALQVTPTDGPGDDSPTVALVGNAGSGSLMLAVEGSTAAVLTTGTSAYDALVGPTGTRNMRFITNNTIRSSVTQNTTASSSTSGTFQVSGGLAVSDNAYIGTTLNAATVNVSGLSASQLVQTDSGKNLISSNTLPADITGPFVKKSGDTMTGQLVFEPDLFIGVKTADGSDSNYVLLTGANAEGVGRGATLKVKGNNTASNQGSVEIKLPTSEVQGKLIVLNESDSPRFAVAANGNGSTSIYGTLDIKGSTSGTISLAAPAIAGTQSYTMTTSVPVPVTATVSPAIGVDQALLSDTSGVMRWVQITTPWTSFSPECLFAASGSNFAETGQWRRVGDMMHVSIQIDFSGTPDTGALTCKLPTDYTIDTAKLVTTNSAYVLPNSRWQGLDAGTNNYSGWITYSSTTAVAASTSLINDHSGTAQSKIGTGGVNGTTPWTPDGNDFHWVYFEVPITGW